MHGALLHLYVMTDEIRTSSVLRRDLALKKSLIGSTARSDSAEEKADRRAGLSLKVGTLFHALADHKRVRERHDRAHDQFGGFARINRLEFASVDAVPQDQFDN